jgi:hypothetical protein
MTRQLEVERGVEPCDVHDVDGRSLGTGKIVLRTPNRCGEHVVVMLEHPEALIQRCLGDGMQEVLLSIGAELPQSARVDRLAVTADHDRVCVLCLPRPDQPAAVGGVTAHT